MEAPSGVLVDPCDLGRRVVEVVIVDGKDGRSDADGQDDRAIRADGVGAPVAGPFRSPSFLVLLAVVEPAPDPCVLLVGDAIGRPLDRVIDLAHGGGKLASGVLATLHEEERCVPCRPGEASCPPSVVDHGAVGVDDDSADVSGKGGAQHVMRMELLTALRLASRSGIVGEMVEQVTRISRSGERVDRRSTEVSARSQAGRSEQAGPVAGVDDDVDQRFRVDASAFGGGTCAEDGDQRIMPSLPGVARERLALGAITVFGTASREVGAELGVLEPSEDPDHLGGLERITAVGSDVEGSTDLDDDGIAVFDLLVAIDVGAIGIGGPDEVFGTLEEVPMGEFFGVGEEHRDERCQVAANAAVAVQLGELDRLRTSEPS